MGAPRITSVLQEIVACRNLNNKTCDTNPCLPRRVCICWHLMDGANHSWNTMDCELLRATWLWHAYLGGASRKVVCRAWRFQKSGRPHLGYHVVCWMHAPHLREKLKSLERSSQFRAPAAATMYTCQLADATLDEPREPPTFFPFYFRWKIRVR